MRPFLSKLRSWKALYYFLKMPLKQILHNHKAGLAALGLVLFLLGFVLLIYHPWTAPAKTRINVAPASQPPAGERQIVINPAGQSTSLQDEISKLQNLYDQAPAGSPIQVRLLIAMGETYVKYGQIRPAIASFEKVLAASPNEKRSHYYLGDLHRVLGETQQTADYWKRYLELDPNSYMRDSIQAFLAGR